MIGFPKHLNSRVDYENMIKDSGYCPEVKRAFQALLNTDKHYLFDRELNQNEEPDGEEPEYKVMMEEGRRVQYRLVDNPSSSLKQLGYTVAQAEEVINHA